MSSYYHSNPLHPHNTNPSTGLQPPPTRLSIYTPEEEFVISECNIFILHHQEKSARIDINDNTTIKAHAKTQLLKAIDFLQQENDLAEQCLASIRDRADRMRDWLEDTELFLENQREFPLVDNVSDEHQPVFLGHLISAKSTHDVLATSPAILPSGVISPSQSDAILQRIDELSVLKHELQITIARIDVLKLIVEDVLNGGTGNGDLELYLPVPPGSMKNTQNSKNLQNTQLNFESAPTEASKQGSNDLFISTYCYKLIQTRKKVKNTEHELIKILSNREIIANYMNKLDHLIMQQRAHVLSTCPHLMNVISVIDAMGVFQFENISPLQYMLNHSFIPPSLCPRSNPLTTQANISPVYYMFNPQTGTHQLYPDLQSALSDTPSMQTRDNRSISSERPIPPSQFLPPNPQNRPINDFTTSKPPNQSSIHQLPQGTPPPPLSPVYSDSPYQTDFSGSTLTISQSILPSSSLSVNTQTSRVSPVNPFSTLNTPLATMGPTASFYASPDTSAPQTPGSAHYYSKHGHTALQKTSLVDQISEIRRGRAILTKIYSVMLKNKVIQNTPWQYMSNNDINTKDDSNDSESYGFQRDSSNFGPSGPISLLSPGAVTQIPSGTSGYNQFFPGNDAPDLRSPQNTGLTLIQSHNFQQFTNLKKEEEYDEYGEPIVVNKPQQFGLLLGTSSNSTTNSASTQNTHDASLLEYDESLPTISGADLVVWLLSAKIVHSLYHAHIVVVLMIKLGILDLVSQSLQINFIQIVDQIAQKQWLKALLHVEYVNLLNTVYNTNNICNYIDSASSISALDLQKQQLLASLRTITPTAFFSKNTINRFGDLNIDHNHIAGLSPFYFNLFRFRQKVATLDGFRYTGYLQKFTKKRVIERFFVFNSENLSLSYYESDLDYQQRLPPTKQYIMSIMSRIAPFDVGYTTTTTNNPGPTSSLSSSTSSLFSFNLTTPRAQPLSSRQNQFFPHTNNSLNSTPSSPNNANNGDINTLFPQSPVIPLTKPPSSRAPSHHLAPSTYSIPNESPTTPMNLSASPSPQTPHGTNLSHSTASIPVILQDISSSTPNSMGNTPMTVCAVAQNVDNNQQNSLLLTQNPQAVIPPKKNTKHLQYYPHLKTSLLQQQAHIHQQIINHPSNFLTSSHFFFQSQLVENTNTATNPQQAQAAMVAQQQYAYTLSQLNNLPQLFDFSPQKDQYFIAITLHDVQYDENIILLQCPSAEERLKWLRCMWRAGCNVELYPIVKNETIQAQRDDAFLHLAALRRRRDRAINKLFDFDDECSSPTSPNGENPPKNTKKDDFDENVLNIPSHSEALKAVPIPYRYDFDDSLLTPDDDPELLKQLQGDTFDGYIEDYENNLSLKLYKLMIKKAVFGLIQSNHIFDDQHLNKRVELLIEKKKKNENTPTTKEQLEEISESKHIDELQESMEIPAIKFDGSHSIDLLLFRPQSPYKQGDNLLSVSSNTIESTYAEPLDDKLGTYHHFSSAPLHWKDYLLNDSLHRLSPEITAYIQNSDKIYDNSQQSRDLQKFDDLLPIYSNLAEVHANSEPTLQIKYNPSQYHFYLQQLFQTHSSTMRSIFGGKPPYDLTRLAAPHITLTKKQHNSSHHHNTLKSHHLDPPPISIATVSHLPLILHPFDEILHQYDIRDTIQRLSAGVLRLYQHANNKYHFLKATGIDDEMDYSDFDSDEDYDEDCNEDDQNDHFYGKSSSISLTVSNSESNNLSGVLKSSPNPKTNRIVEKLEKLFKICDSTHLFTRLSLQPRHIAALYRFITSVSPTTLNSPNNNLYSKHTLSSIFRLLTKHIEYITLTSLQLPTSLPILPVSLQSPSPTRELAFYHSFRILKQYLYSTVVSALPQTTKQAIMLYTTDLPNIPTLYHNLDDHNKILLKSLHTTELLWNNLIFTNVYTFILDNIQLYSEKRKNNEHTPNVEHIPNSSQSPFSLMLDQIRPLLSNIFNGINSIALSSESINNSPRQIYPSTPTTAFQTPPNTKNISNSFQSPSIYTTYTPQASSQLQAALQFQQLTQGNNLFRFCIDETTYKPLPTSVFDLASLSYNSLFFSNEHSLDIFAEQSKDNDNSDLAAQFAAQSQKATKILLTQHKTMSYGEKLSKYLYTDGYFSRIYTNPQSSCYNPNTALSKTERFGPTNDPIEKSQFPPVLLPYDVISPLSPLIFDDVDNNVKNTSKCNINSQSSSSIPTKSTPQERCDEALQYMTKANEFISSLLYNCTLQPSDFTKPPDDYNNGYGSSTEQSRQYDLENLDPSAPPPAAIPTLCALSHRIVQATSHVMVSAMLVEQRDKLMQSLTNQQTVLVSLIEHVKKVVCDYLLVADAQIVKDTQNNGRNTKNGKTSNKVEKINTMFLDKITPLLGKITTQLHTIKQTCIYVKCLESSPTFLIAPSPISVLYATFIKYFNLTYANAPHLVPIEHLCHGTHGHTGDGTSNQNYLPHFEMLNKLYPQLYFNNNNVAGITNNTNPIISSVSQYNTNNNAQNNVLSQLSPISSQSTSMSSLKSPPQQITHLQSFEHINLREYAIPSENLLPSDFLHNIPPNTHHQHAATLQALHPILTTFCSDIDTILGDTGSTYQTFFSPITPMIRAMLTPIYNLQRAENQIQAINNASALYAALHPSKLASPEKDQTCHLINTSPKNDEYFDTITDTDDECDETAASNSANTTTTMNPAAVTTDSVTLSTSTSSNTPVPPVTHLRQPSISQHTQTSSLSQNSKLSQACPNRLVPDDITRYLQQYGVYSPSYTPPSSQFPPNLEEMSQTSQNQHKFLSLSQILYPQAIFTPYSIPYHSPRYLEHVKTQAIQDIHNFVTVLRSIIFDVCHFTTIHNDVYDLYWNHLPAQDENSTMFPPYFEPPRSVDCTLDLSHYSPFQSPSKNPGPALQKPAEDGGVGIVDDDFEEIDEYGETKQNHAHHAHKPAQKPSYTKFARSPHVMWVIERTIFRLLFFCISPTLSRLYQILYTYKDLTLQQRIKYYRTISMRKMSLNQSLTFTDFLSQVKKSFNITPQSIPAPLLSHLTQQLRPVNSFSTVPQTKAEKDFAKVKEMISNPGHSFTTDPIYRMLANCLTYPQSPDEINNHLLDIDGLDFLNNPNHIPRDAIENVHTALSNSVTNTPLSPYANSCIRFSLLPYTLDPYDKLIVLSRLAQLLCSCVDDAKYILAQRKIKQLHYTNVKSSLQHHQQLLSNLKLKRKRVNTSVSTQTLLDDLNLLKSMTSVGQNPERSTQLTIPGLGPQITSQAQIPSALDLNSDDMEFAVPLSFDKISPNNTHSTSLQNIPPGLPPIIETKSPPNENNHECNQSQDQLHLLEFYTEEDAAQFAKNSEQIALSEVNFTQFIHTQIDSTLSPQIVALCTPKYKPLPSHSPQISSHQQHSQNSSSHHSARLTPLLPTTNTDEIDELVIDAHVSLNTDSLSLSKVTKNLPKRVQPAASPHPPKTYNLNDIDAIQSEFDQAYSPIFGAKLGTSTPFLGENGDEGNQIHTTPLFLSSTTFNALTSHKPSSDSLNDSIPPTVMDTSIHSIGGQSSYLRATKTPGLLTTGLAAKHQHHLPPRGSVVAALTNHSTANTMSKSISSPTDDTMLVTPLIQGDLISSTNTIQNRILLSSKVPFTPAQALPHITETPVNEHIIQTPKNKPSLPFTASPQQLNYIPVTPVTIIPGGGINSDSSGVEHSPTASTDDKDFDLSFFLDTGSSHDTVRLDSCGITADKIFENEKNCDELGAPSQILTFHESSSREDIASLNKYQQTPIPINTNASYTPPPPFAETPLQSSKEKEAKPVILGADDLLVLTVMLLVRSSDLSFISRLINSLETMKKYIQRIEQQENEAILQLTELYKEVKAAKNNENNPETSLCSQSLNINIAADTPRNLLLLQAIPTPTGSSASLRSFSSSSSLLSQTNNVDSRRIDYTSLYSQLDRHTTLLTENTRSLEQQLDVLTLLFQDSSSHPLTQDNNDPSSLSATLAVTQDYHPGCTSLATQLQMVDDFISERDRCLMMGYYLATTQAAVGLFLVHDPNEIHLQEDYF